MIVVTGATGRLGRGVVVRRGDYDDPDGLPAAFGDADVLLFVCSPNTEPGVRQRQHRDVVRAAVQAQVGRIVYTSVVNAERAPRGPR